MSVLIKGVDMPKKHHMNCYYIDDDGKVFDVSRKIIIGEAIQYIEPERKKGKWKEGKYTWDDRHYNDTSYKCSCCGRISDWSYNYCPNCGTDMRGNKDEQID